MTISPVELTVIETAVERSEWADRGETLTAFVARVRKTPVEKYEWVEISDPRGVLWEPFRTIDFMLSNWACGSCEACRGRPSRACTQSPARLFVSFGVDWKRRAVEAEQALADASPLVRTSQSEDQDQEPLTRGGNQAAVGRLQSSAASPEVLSATAPEWQPIETAPRDGTHIDAWCSSTDGVDQWRLPDAWWDAKREKWVNHNGMYDVATHWMPLPRSPI